MAGTAQKIEDFTLNISIDTHVKAGIEATFSAVLDQMGPLNTTPEGVALKMKLEDWPGGRWYRDLGDGNGHFLGQRTSDQAADAAGDLWAAVCLVSAAVKRTIPAERREGRNADQVSSHGAGLHR
jgi:hypothetical protein